MKPIFYWGEAYIGSTSPMLYKVDESTSWNAQQVQPYEVMDLVEKGYAEISAQSAIAFGWPV